MPLPPLPPPTYETFPSTPAKKKQRNLFEVLGVSTEKHKKQDDNVGSETHQKLRKMLSSESLSKFEAELKGLRELEAVVALRRDVKHELRRPSWLIRWFKAGASQRAAKGQGGREGPSDRMQIPRRSRDTGEEKQAPCFVDTRVRIRSSL